jgi:type I restriction enzyme S subunit
MIPDDWAECGLDQLSNAPISYGVVKPGDHDPQGVPFIRGGDFPEGRLDPKSLRTITRKVSDSYKRTRLIGGEILISLVGYPGACVVVPPELAGANIARQAAVIRPKNSISTGFLFQFIRSPIGQARLLEKTIGSAQQVINLKDLREVIIPTPPLAEQRRIAEVLSNWDRAIETMEALISTARTQKKALIQSLLTGKTRLPGFSGAWATEKLGRLCQISKGEQLGRLAMIDGGTVPVINGGISASGYTDRANTPGHSITISEGGNSCGFVSLIHQPFWCGGHCYALKDLNIDRSFLFASLKHREAEIMTLRVGSGLPNIQKKALSGIELRVPPRPEQEAIGLCTDMQNREINGLQGQLAALREEKSALMQQLLTGKRRVTIMKDVEL